MGVIFDLDQTLIMSEKAHAKRQERKWDEVYRLIPELPPFDGICELIEKLNNKSIPVCIVTSSPASYCNRIIRQWGWRNVVTVCYHDTTLRKPHPAPILKGISKLGVDASKVVSIGDDPKDIIASKAAGVKSIGVLWGCINKQALIESRPDEIFSTVDELDQYLTSLFNL